MATPAYVVLIGEPDRATATLYQRVLGASFDVLIAVDEQAVIELLRTRQVTVLVLEVAIFGEGSWERLALVSQIGIAQGAQLVICSTHDERRRGAEVGAVAYLVKPTLPSTLLHTIQQLINLPKSPKTA